MKNFGGYEKFSKNLRGVRKIFEIFWSLRKILRCSYSHKKLKTPNLPRTNNNVEGWHNGLQANINACHPNLWKFLDVLKQEENLSGVKLTQCLAGIPQPERKSTKM